MSAESPAHQANGPEAGIGEQKVCKLRAVLEEKGSGSDKTVFARVVLPVGQTKGVMFQACAALSAAKLHMPEQGELDSKLYQNRNEGIKPVKREHANSRKKYSGQDRVHSVCGCIRQKCRPWFGGGNSGFTRSQKFLEDLRGSAP